MKATLQSQALTRERGSFADAALALVIVSIVAIMIVPLPTWLLDLLITSNLALAVLVIVSALYVPSALAFSTLPTLLLISTLYRLALNVSSTRLILLQADAGRVIRAFGDFVVRGNYVVGGVVFAILTLIQYLVVAKGGERVAEVSARFTLDALPGKQLAIDADLRAGALRVPEARARRAQLERENQFYGAMDGAMKFVKGDAIAGIVIAVISLVGGGVIGVAMHGLPVGRSLQLYGLLTVGDGLVSQIPSLLISTAAGLVVTRVSGEEAALGSSIALQLFGDPRVLAIAAVFLALLGLVPGLPALPFLVLAAALGVAARASFLERAKRPAEHAVSTQAPASVLIELGEALAERAGDDAGRRLLQDAIDTCSHQLQARLGVPQLTSAMQPNLTLEPDGYRVLLRETPILQGRASDSITALAQKLRAELLVVLSERARELLTIDDVQRALDELEAHSPALVKHVVPSVLTLPKLCELQKRLLAEGVSVRALPRLLEALSSVPQGSEPADVITLLERCRHALREQICNELLRDGVLAVHRVEPMIEDAIRDAIQPAKPERYLALAPTLARDIVSAARKLQDAQASKSAPLVLVTQPELRPWLRELLAAELPQISVLSFSELPPTLSVEQRAPLAI